MRHFEILVSLNPKNELQFKRRLPGGQLVDAKSIRTRPGDTVSWELHTQDKMLLASLQGISVRFPGPGSPFGRNQDYSYPSQSQTPALKVRVNAVGRNFPYDLTLDGTEIRSDPTVDVDEPGQPTLYMVSQDEGGRYFLQDHEPVESASLLTFGCEDMEGNPVDFVVFFGGMRPEDWPVYPPVSYSEPVRSVPGFGVTNAAQVIPVTEPRDFIFELVTSREDRIMGKMTVVPRLLHASLPAEAH